MCIDLIKQDRNYLNCIPPKILYSKEIKRLLLDYDDIETVRELFDIITIPENCLICMESNTEGLNLRCNNKFNHYYCLECFTTWYKQDKKK